jgi:hypothetical protein
MKDTKTSARPLTPALDLEVQEIEAFCHPGCGTSTTSHACTCPVSATTTASLFIAKTAG